MAQATPVIIFVFGRGGGDRLPCWSGAGGVEEEEEEEERGGEEASCKRKKHMWARAKTTKCYLAFLILIDESYNYSGHRDE